MIAYVPSLVFRKVRPKAGADKTRFAPIHLRDWLGMRRFMRRACEAPDALVPPMETFRGTGSTLSDAELARILEKDELGTWALDVASIEVLWEKLQADMPAAVMEFGAGVSTVLLARYADWREAEGAERPIIISLEQDERVQEKVEQRLASLRMSEGVHVMHAPLLENSRYCIDLEHLKQRLNGRALDWLLIDGPAGPEGCRDSTLPDVMALCRDGARWFLDDALRDGELGILRSWSRLRGVEVEGIYPIGKGLATGRLWRNG